MSTPGTVRHYEPSQRLGRAHSFGHQVHTVLQEAPESVLEVGVGDGTVAAALRSSGVAVTTLDVDPALAPDILASVLHIPADEGAWDVGCCCQVLEHLPFDQLGPALLELHRVLRRRLVLSLPDVTRHLRLSARLPRLGLRTLALDLPSVPPRPFDPARRASMGHHWEIGFRGTPLVAVRTVMAVSGWRELRTWRVPELPWHRFFLLAPDVEPDTARRAA